MPLEVTAVRCVVWKSVFDVIKKAGEKLKQRNLTLVVAGGLATLTIVSSREGTASFSKETTRFYVEANGVSFGSFASAEGLEKLNSTEVKKGLQKITLTRSFVTEPSLYHWANDRARTHTERVSMTVTALNKDGHVLGRYVLQDTQPVFWTIESAGGHISGFHEKVELATTSAKIVRSTQ